MTAVDHAELKRLADELREASSGRGHAIWERGCQSCAMDSNVMDKAADALEALLSEIEGLKAFNLRTQAPDSWRPEVSDEDLAVLSQIIHSEYYYGADSMGAALRRIYLALRPQTAEG